MWNRAAFLDRDGVLFRAIIRDGRPYAPRSMSEVAYLPEIERAVEALRQAGFRIIVVTNQPDVARGLLRRAVVEQMHEALARHVPIDEIKTCYHADTDGCACRKPQPGLLLEAAQRWKIALSRSVMIGDRWRDIEAGKAAGGRTILIASRYAERPAEQPDAVVASLWDASRLVCGRWEQDRSSSMEREPIGAETS